MLPGIASPSPPPPPPPSLPGGLKPDAASTELRGTLSEHKHELLHTRFGINYAKLPEMFRRGTVLQRTRKRARTAESVAGGAGDAADGVASAAAATPTAAVAAATAAAPEVADSAEVAAEATPPPAAPAAAAAAAAAAGSTAALSVPPVVVPKSVTLCHPELVKSRFLEDHFAAWS